MKRIALVSSEPIRPAMAGIGIRYLEMARRLPAACGGEVETVLVSPAEEAAMRELSGAGEGGSGVAAVRRFERGRLAEILGDCDAAVAQGQLANDVVIERPALPVAIDLYDPWLVENLHYVETLGLDPYRNDHATWVLQMSRGDFFLCSSEEQKTFYLGFLAALGRVNPERLAADPDLDRLIAPVPFGLPAEPPPHRPLLPAREQGEKRILFGGLYDWYDPHVLLDALERVGERRWTLYFVTNPNPDSTPQRLLGEIERRCRARGWWGSRVRLTEWVPADRRWDLLRDADVLVSPHRPSLETRLSLRTRYLDAAAVGCPVIATEGGTVARLLREHGAGRVVPPGDPEALAAALAALLDHGPTEAERTALAALASRFTWDRALAPLAAFCRDPKPDPTKERFAFRPSTVAPPDRLTFRLRRWLHRRLHRFAEAFQSNKRGGWAGPGGRPPARELGASAGKPSRSAPEDYARSEAQARATPPPSDQRAPVPGGGPSARPGGGGGKVRAPVPGGGPSARPGGGGG